jgi:hypothetical protein
LQRVASSKLIKRIRDDRFDEDNIHAYTLLLNLGPKDLQAAVVGDGNRVLYLEDNVFPAVASGQELVVAVDELLDHHAFLKAGFWNHVKLSMKNQKLVQVPGDLFSDDSSGDYLRFNASYDAGHDDVLFTKMTNSEAVTVFAVPRKLKGLIDDLYPQTTVSVIHQSAALIEGVMDSARSRSDNPLYLYVDRFKLHVLSVKDSKLIYYNQFSIHNFEDYVKYIMLVMNTLGMDQQTSEVVLWGYIGANSPHYHEFYKYIRNVTFGKRPAHLTFGYPFDEVQDHHFFDLYSINLCA